MQKLHRYLSENILKNILLLYIRLMLSVDMDLSNENLSILKGLLNHHQVNPLVVMVTENLRSKYAMEFNDGTSLLLLKCGKQHLKTMQTSISFVPMVGTLSLYVT
jgi:hypothetical protein